MFGFDKKSYKKDESSIYMRDSLITSSFELLLTLYAQNINDFFGEFSQKTDQLKLNLMNIDAVVTNSLERGTFVDDIPLRKSLLEAQLIFIGLPEKHDVLNLMKYMHDHKNDLLALDSLGNEEIKIIKSMSGFYETFKTLNDIHTLYTKRKLYEK